MSVLAAQLTEGSHSHLERECLTEFFQMLSNVRPHLVQCYAREDVPRTNNMMERSIQGLKTPDQRVSICQNGNVSLLRYGRCVVCAA
jgi:hypothetical protein